MHDEIFKSERYFTIFDTFISHGQLLFRSQKSENNISNIDIIFFNTNYIQILSRLKGVCVKQVNKEAIHISDTVDKYLSHSSNYLFEVESESDRYYIVASSVKVFENQLEFHESSLGFENKGREKEIASSSDNM